MIDAEVSLVLPLAATAVLASVARIATRSWLHPAAFLPLCWTVYLGAAIVLVGDFPLRLGGLWVIWAMVLAFVVGGLATTAPSPEEEQAPVSSPATPTALTIRRLLVLTLAFSILAALGVVGMFWGGVSSFGLAASPEALLRLGREFSVARYGGFSPDLPRSVTLLLYWTYPAAVLGGMLFGAAGGRPAVKVLALVPLLLAFANGLTTASRAGLLLAGAMWVSAVLAMGVYREGVTVRLFHPRWIAGTLVGGLALVAAYALLQWIRGGADNPFYAVALARRAVAAFLGATAAFTEWFAVAKTSAPSWGAITFAGPFDLLQFAERQRGIYDTEVYFAVGLGTNIYTLFRGLIEDFGFVGSWLACLLSGALSSVAFRRCCCGLVTWVVPLSAFYSMILFSHLYSMFIFNSVIAGWGIAFATLLWPFPRVRADRVAVERA